MRTAHWHPVHKTFRGPGPVKVRLCGRDIALFRTASGRLGAVPDICLHRRASLSRGQVHGERLVCPYHGWSYEPSGRVTSPGTPRLDLEAPCFEVVERFGAVWIRDRGATTRFPTVAVDGWASIGVFRHVVRAPMPVVLDNFVEVEHTGRVHLLLGYAEDRMSEVQVAVETDERSVRVVNRGPQKPLPAAIRALFGLAPEDTFVDDWTTWFSPVYSVYDHYWEAPDGAMRPVRLRTAVFFNPVDDDATELWTFAFAHAMTPLRSALQTALRPLSRALVEIEVRRDRAMIESLADKRPDLRGMKLSRFDRALGENRRRIAAIYDTGDAA